MPTGLTAKRRFEWTMGDTLSVARNLFLTTKYVFEAMTLSKLVGQLVEAPLGSPVVVDVSALRGQTLLPIGTITIPAGSLQGITEVKFDLVVADLLRADLVAVGTTFPGKTLQVLALRAN